VKRLILSIAVALGSLLLWCPAALGATYHVSVCGPWSSNTGPFKSAAVPGTFVQVFGCGSTAATMALQASGVPAVPNGQGANWTATAPAGLTITRIYTLGDSSGQVGDGHGWWGEFFWNGGPGPAGRSGQINDNFYKYGCCQASFNNQTVGWFIACGWSSCTQAAGMNVGGVDLVVDESQGPWLVAPSDLWQTSGWVRDRYQLVFYGDSPSGVCQVSASINGQSVTLGPNAAVGRDHGTWHQCAGASASTTIQTADYGQGPIPLKIEGCDAAGVCTGGAYTKTIQVDNSHPSVSLSSPGDVPVTAGTQYVTVTAGGSPSGIAEIDCSVDGGPTQRFSEGGALQPSVQVPVSGLGVHTVQCSAANTAVAQDGSRGWSTSPATTALKIGEPTASAIAFGKVINALRCKRTRKRVRVPARWVTVRRHHKLVRIRQRAHTKVVKVVRCHPRVVWRRVTVWVTVRRHGKNVRVRRRKMVRVVLTPRLVGATTRRVRFGHGTTVGGWLGTGDGTALGGEVVRVLTAPDNGLGQFSQAAVATTAANGGWSAALPPGPSRLVEAIYDGAPTTEASQSAQVHLVVPAKVKLLSVSPRRVAWGGTVRITGQLLGGYLPPGGALVRLRIGQGSSYQTYGVQEHVAGSGRFTTTYTFGVGDPSFRRSFWFQLGTLPVGDYPYAPAASGRRSVLVGGHPRPVARHKRRHRHPGPRRR
jgi:hypothetical protein